MELPAKLDLSGLTGSELLRLKEMLSNVLEDPGNVNKILDRGILERIWGESYVADLMIRGSLSIIDEVLVKYTIGQLQSNSVTDYSKYKYSEATVEAQREKAARWAYKRIFVNMRLYLIKLDKKYAKQIKELKKNYTMQATPWIAMKPVGNPRLDTLRKLVYKELTNQLDDDDFMILAEGYSAESRANPTLESLGNDDIVQLYAKYRVGVRNGSIPAPKSFVPYYQNLISELRSLRPFDQTLAEIARGSADFKGSPIDVWDRAVSTYVISLCDRCKNLGEIIGFCVKCSAVFCQNCVN